MVLGQINDLAFSFSQVLLHVLFEHAAGYALFAVKEVEEIGMLLPQVCILKKCRKEVNYAFQQHEEPGS